MIPANVMAELRHVQLTVRKLVNQTFAGSYRSAFRGQGLEFEEVRQYVPGDDVRMIDWKVTARRQAPHIKSFRQERELNVMLALDVSASTLFGTRGSTRAERIATVSAALATVAMFNRDRVGCLAFADEIEFFAPPERKRSMTYKVIREVLRPRAEEAHKTDIASALRYLRNTLRRRSLVFLISDFQTLDCANELKRLSRKHEVIAIRVGDPVDEALAFAPISITARELETGKVFPLELRSASVRKAYAEKANAARQNIRRFFRECSVDLLELSTDKPFVNDLRFFFERRARKR